MIDLDGGFVIAEAGTCHAGGSEQQRIAKAIAYVWAASEAGADAVKFQWFHDPNPQSMFCWIEGDEERAVRWLDSAISLEGWREVKEAADTRGIILLASTFEHRTVGWLKQLDIQATKVASRAAKTFPYGDAPRPRWISDGMFSALRCVGDDVVLQCEANYPSTMRWKPSDDGFSDHSANPWFAIEALAKGCRLIEVHFYIHPEDAGPDLPASLTTEQLKLVCQARDAFAAMNEDSE